MALLVLYFDLSSKNLAFGPQGPGGAILPVLKQEGALSLHVSFIRRVAVDPFGQASYEIVNLAAWSLRVSIGTAGSVLATQNTFAVDSTNTKFVGALALNTVGINALTDRQAGIYFEINYTDADGGGDGRRFDCLIEKAIYTSGAVIVPPTDMALTELKASRLYMKKEGAPGEGYILKSEDSAHRVFTYLHNDGTLRSEEVT